MGLLKRLFGKNEPDLTDRARSLVALAQVFATSSAASVAKDFRSIGTVEPQRWDFVFTIGGVFVAVSQLNHESLSEHTKNVLLDIVTEAVAAWHPRGLNAVEDCRRYVDRTYDGLMTLPEYKTNPRFLFSDSLGGWVVWNLLDRAPSTREEKQLVRVLGGMLVHSFIYWWRVA